MGHNFRLQKLFIKDLLVMETPVSLLSQYIGFLVKKLSWQVSHEVVPLVSLRTLDGQMIIQN